jgi:hypothetical protein
MTWLRLTWAKLAALHRRRLLGLAPTDAATITTATLMLVTVGTRCLRAGSCRARRADGGASARMKGPLTQTLSPWERA